MSINAKTPVQLLHEYCVKHHETPSYNLICNGTGSHEPIFKYEVRAFSKVAIGTGSSKKQAKHDAAQLLMCIINDVDSSLELSSSNVYSPYANTVTDNAVGALQDFCCTHRLQDPAYILVDDSGPPHNKLFSMKCSVSTMFYEATDRTKQQAKHRSAAGLLSKMKPLVLGGDFDYSSLTAKVESLQLSDDTIKAIELLKERNRLIAMNTPAKTFGLDIKKVIDMFQENQYSMSEILNTLKAKSKEELRQMENIEDLLSSLLNDMNISFHINVIPSRRNISVVTVFLEMTPGWNFMRIGPNVESAKRAAILATLEFMVGMT